MSKKFNTEIFDLSLHTQHLATLTFKPAFPYTSGWTLSTTTPARPLSQAAQWDKKQEDLAAYGIL